VTYSLEAHGISKHFGGARALADASIRVRPGTVHALLGGNGSGKSTLIKCLAGVYPADTGAVRLRGREIAAEAITPQLADEAGLRFVHQDLGLFDFLTVAENFALGTRFPRNPIGGIRWRSLRRRVAELLRRFEIQAGPDTPVGRLRPATKTMVAIARALQDQEDNEHILLLDEPTASLADAESRELMESLRRRAAAGQTIVLVSHRLPEVLATAHDFTVFRDGRVAGTLESAAPTEDQLIELMAGRAERTSVRHGPASTGEVALQLDQIVAGPLTGLSLSVAAGEIVGLAGLLGSGRSTALGVSFGVRRPAGGSVRMSGRDVTGQPASAMIRRGAALVPQDRLLESVWPSMSVAENLSMSVLGRFFRGWMRRGPECAEAAALVRRFGIKTPSVAVPIAGLSGGNQQKVVLSRWLRRDPAVLLLDEPTQGVDVMSRADIYRHIRAAAAQGCAVLVASSDFSELADLCDRVVVLREGRAAASVPASELTADRLTDLVQRTAS
jgi:ribose transport system ATP-binding protein